MVYKTQNKKGKAKKNKPVTENKGNITVKEAGRRGGNTTKARYAASGYYEAIGKKGGQKVKQLIAAGKKALADE